MNHTEANATEQHTAEFDARLAACTFRGNQQPITPDDKAGIARTTDTADMVNQVQRQIETLERRLAETRGFNTKTGQADLVISAADPRRQALVNELHHLNTAVLPYTKAQAAAIEATRSRLPTQAQELQAEADRQARLIAAAHKRAEEIEVDEMAKRILAGRNGGR